MPGANRITIPKDIWDAYADAVRLDVVGNPPGMLTQNVHRNWMQLTFEDYNKAAEFWQKLLGVLKELWWT